MATHAPITGASSRAPETRNPHLGFYRPPVVRVIESLLRETGMSATKFGTLALGDPRFVHDLRGGREPRIATERRAYAFMAEHREGC